MKRLDRLDKNEILEDLKYMLNNDSIEYIDENIKYFNELVTDNGYHEISTFNKLGDMLDIKIISNDEQLNDYISSVYYGRNLSDLIYITDRIDLSRQFYTLKDGELNLITEKFFKKMLKLAVEYIEAK